MLEHDGFPLTWFDVLSRLADAGPAGLRMQELEELALFTRGGLTRLVDRIEAAGLVRREPVPGDRRGVRVVLTADGRQRYTAALARHREVIEREFGRRLTPAQHRAVADALWPWWHDAPLRTPQTPASLIRHTIASSLMASRDCSLIPGHGRAAGRLVVPSAEPTALRVPGRRARPRH